MHVCVQAGGDRLAPLSTCTRGESACLCTGRGGGIGSHHSVHVHEVRVHVCVQAGGIGSHHSVHVHEVRVHVCVQAGGDRLAPLSTCTRGESACLCTGRGGGIGSHHSVHVHEVRVHVCVQAGGIGSHHSVHVHEVRVHVCVQAGGGDRLAPLSTCTRGESACLCTGRGGWARTTQYMYTR